MDIKTARAFDSNYSLIDLGLVYKTPPRQEYTLPNSNDGRILI